ncbi:tetratricopeptide repeat protein [Erythrobacter sp. HKB08]|uniref:tetratricopeptide repeat protein n=1 Tax=Erythrobacter sp. HKB08 TaxID=2502843 RepID=UPI001008C90A|nr:tetratricopeptide repeat protein [Erythrobacter sp. HKB08]
MKTIRNLALVALASAALAGCGMTPEEKQTRAEENMAQNLYSQARLDLVSALKDKPGDETMLRMLAEAQLAIGDGEGAATTLDKLPAGDEVTLMMAEADVLRGRFDAAIERLSGSGGADASRLRVLAFIGEGKVVKASEELERSLAEAGANDASLLATASRFELLRGDRQKAREFATRSLAADAGNLEGLLVSGDIASGDNRLPQSLAHFEKAHDRYPESVAALLGRAGALTESGRFDDAAEVLDNRSGNFATDARITGLRARVAAGQGEWEKARSLLQKIEPEMRENPGLQLVYAEALLRVGQVEQSRTWLSPLVSRSPASRKPRGLLAEAKLESGDAAGALATIRAIAERPDATPAELEIATKAARALKDPAAERFATRARQPSPEWIGGELAKGDTALRNRQWAKAVSAYEAIDARSRTPNAMVLNNLAFAKSQLGEKAEATDIALRALEIAPDHPSVMDTAGWLLFSTGRDKMRGTQLLRRASALDPDNTAIAQRLAKAERG